MSFRAPKKFLGISNIYATSIRRFKSEAKDEVWHSNITNIIVLAHC